MNEESRSDQDADDAFVERLRGALVDENLQPSQQRVAEVRAAAARRDRVEVGGRPLAGASFIDFQKRRAPFPALPTAATLLRVAAVVLVAGSAGVLGRLTTPDAPAPPPTEVVALAGVPKEYAASARLINHTWGVELLLDVNGVSAGSTFDVRYVTSEGSVAAGSFVGDPERLMRCRFNAAVLRADLDAIEITQRSGEVSMRAELV